MTPRRETQPILCYVEGCWAYFTTQALKDQWGDDWNASVRLAVPKAMADNTEQSAVSEFCEKALPTVRLRPRREVFVCAVVVEIKDAAIGAVISQPAIHATPPKMLYGADFLLLPLPSLDVPNRYRIGVGSIFFTLRTRTTAFNRAAVLILGVAGNAVRVLADRSLFAATRANRLKFTPITRRILCVFLTPVPSSRFGLFMRHFLSIQSSPEAINE